MCFILYVSIPSNRVNVSYSRGESHRAVVLRRGVSIPSNRVNVSYFLTDMTLTHCLKTWKRSQSPQIGSMFLTYEKETKNTIRYTEASQSPRIGSMFLTRQLTWVRLSAEPLQVAIPSNRVNVSYEEVMQSWLLSVLGSQSPQIGSMFLTWKIYCFGCLYLGSRNPLKSGQCFLRLKCKTRN